MAEASAEIRPKGPARKPGVVANVLAIVGFIILIIIVIWGVLHLINLSTPWFTDLFNTKKPAIVVTAPSNVTSGTPFTLTWKYSSANRGSYAMLYTCAAGLKMSVDGHAIPCGAAFTVGNATSSVSILPTLSSTSTVSTATSNISILYIPSAAGTTGPEATGVATVRVVAGTQTATTPIKTETPSETPTPSKPVTVTPTPTPSVPATPSDLSVRIIAVGVIDPYTGAFVARAPYSQNETSAVEFDIANLGGSPTGAYTFQAQIPTTQPYVFTSQVQPSLGAGSHVVNTLRFTPAVDGTFSVQVLGSDGVKANNFASQWITGAPYNQYPQYQQQYVPQYQY